MWVGYPDVNTSMTNVPGWGTMFGGLAPASIWHDFMTTAMAGRKCEPFPQPKVPFVAQPFFGKYATTGAPGGAVDPLATTTTPSTKDKNGKKKGADNKKFPPSQYESPPQQTPGTGTGNGQGNGTGNGQGNGGGTQPQTGGFAPPGSTADPQRPPLRAPRAAI